MKHILAALAVFAGSLAWADIPAPWTGGSTNTPSAISTNKVHVGQTITFRWDFTNGTASSAFPSDYTGDQYFATWRVTNAVPVWPTNSVSWSEAEWAPTNTPIPYNVMVTNLSDFSDCEKWHRWIEWYPYDGIVNMVDCLTVEFEFLYESVVVTNE